MQHPLVPAIIVALLMTAALAGKASATQFPITDGTVIINGESGALPSGGTFGDSNYNTVTGYLSDGKFVFPQTSITITTPLGDLLVTYQFAQTNTSSAMIGGDGTVAFTTANMQLRLVSAKLGGVIPIGVTPCSFSPIAWDDVGGTASSTGMQIENEGFTVPPTTDACGGHKDEINDALNGNQNSISMTISGDFTPPVDDDLIFRDGFDTIPAL